MAARFEILNAVALPLVSVTVWGELVISTGWLEKARLLGERVTPFAVLAPVPLKLTVWGLALLAILSDPARLPEADGVKVTLIVQLAPAATVAPQLLDWVKSLAFDPIMTMLETVRVTLPELVNVIDCAALAVPTGRLPKLRLEGETLAADAVPVPERVTDWGLPLALSAMLSDAARLPLPTGAKVTLMLHEAPAATEPPQLLAWAKSPALTPESPMLLMVKVPLPELVRVTVCPALVVPTVWFPKLRLEGETLAADAVPVPERATVWGLPVALSVIVRAAERFPVAAGLKLTLIVQLAPAATLDPQLLVWAKSLTLAPEIAMLVTLKDAVPELERVID